MSVTEVSVVVMATGMELGAWDLARFTWNWGQKEGREGGREGGREEAKWDGGSRNGGRVSIS